MSDLISRKALIDILAKYKFGAIKSESEREYTKETVMNFVKEQPSVEAVPVVHGEWVKNKQNPEVMKKFHEMGIGKGMGVNSIYWTCSECGSWGTPTSNFCSNCGADMRKKV